MPEPIPAVPTAPLSVSQDEAVRLTGVSAKTLKRRFDKGEPVGRIEIGRKVVFHFETLKRWLADQAVTAAHAARAVGSPPPATA